MRIFSYVMPPKEREPSPLAKLTAPLARARVVAEAAQRLRERGFVPDVICAQIGWGEAIFLKDVFPEAKLVLYSEFFYSARGADTGFDPEFASAASPAETAMRTRLMNAPLTMAMDAADAGISPTEWQRSRFPAHQQAKIRVVHEGIDTEAIRPSREARFTIPGKDLVLGAGEPVVTYAARNLEPYRGFHVFMRAVPEILARRPKAHVVIVGGDRVSYSPRLPAGQTYRQCALRELGARLDMSRVHFIPWLAHADYVSLLQVSAAHVYLTYPFVLSWSMLEAMAAGVALVASRTAPVEEVVRDGENGLLVDFFSPAELAEKVGRLLTAPQRFAAMREAARRTVCERYDLRRVCLPAQVAFVESHKAAGTAVQTKNPGALSSPGFSVAELAWR